METLYLPYVTAQTPLVTAMERMRQTDSRAIVVFQGVLEHRLHMNDAVIEAWAAKKEWCSDLGSGGRSALALPANPGTVKLSELFSVADELPPWWVFHGLFEHVLDASGMDFGVLYPPDQLTGSDTVLVITRHETYRDQIRDAPKRCVCNGPGRHVADCPPGADRGECQDCFPEGTYDCY